MNNLQLKLFIDPDVLWFTGRSLLAQFFARFTHLLPSKRTLPTTYDDWGYSNALALVLRDPQAAGLPEPLVQAVYEVEALAAPENWPMPGPPDGDAPQHPESYRLFKAIHRWLEEHTERTTGPLTTGPLTSQTPTAEPAPGSASPGAPSSPPPALCPSINYQLSTIDQASTPENETEEQTFLRLARLSPTEYDRARLKEARRLGVRGRVLDKEVARRRSQLDDAQANVVILPELEPWPEPILNAPALFSQVSDCYSRRIVFPAGGADATTLWTGHAHVFWVFHITPRLNFLSPEPGCGKSTALEVIGTMVPRPLSADSFTPGVMIRVVDVRPPTLVLDELDAYLHANNELRGLLNAGHKRGGCAYRCEAGGKKVRAFKAFAPAALAGLGALPATLRDRSILIHLVKAKEGEILEPFDPQHAALEQELGRKLARWAKDNLAAIQACKPALPSGIFNRVADNWRPLFAVAQVVGGDWPQRALDAFTSLNANPPVQDRGLVVLGDIQRIFAQSAAPRLFSAELVDSLCALPDRQYSHPASLKPQGVKMTEATLARCLGRFGVRSRNLRIGDAQARGYEFADLAEPFARFLNGDGDQ